MKLKKRAIKGEWTRDFLIERASINEEARTVEFALSSETPYERWYGIEILGHGPGEVNLERLNNKAAWLVGHDSSDHVGVIESARVDPDRVLRVVVRFGRSARASEIFQDIVDGIRTKVSVGYMTGDYEMTKGSQGSPDTYRFTNWMPYEGSTVSIPADDTVGQGRASEHGCRNAECDDPECQNPECDGECSAGAKCKSCTDEKAIAPGQTRELPPTPPAPPAGTVKESDMDPKQQIAAALAAGTITKAQADAMLRALENPDGDGAERTETTQLMMLAAGLGLQKEAAEILGGATPLAEARVKLMGILSAKAAQPLPGPGIDMSAREAKTYSYARAILYSVLRREGVRVDRGFEDEVADTISKSLPANYQAKGGIFVPMQLRTGLDSATSTGGAELKYTEFGGELIELLRNQSAVIRMGARPMPGLTSPISFPRQSGAGTAYWLGENPGADVTESAMAFDNVTLTPKTLMSMTRFSRQLLQQSVVAVEPLVRQDLAAVHALAVDKAAIHGLGSANQPTGIYRTTGVGTKAMGGVPTYGKLQDMITTVAVANALMNNLGWITTPGMAGILAQTLASTTAGAKYIWDGPYDDGKLNGYRAFATNQVSALMSTLVDTGGAQHGIIFGDWSSLMLGMWGALELLTDPYTLAGQAMVKVTGFQMADIEIRHPASFAVSTGATLS